MLNLSSYLNGNIHNLTIKLLFDYEAKCIALKPSLQSNDSESDVCNDSGDPPPLSPIISLLLS